jgi:hypothetical protein
MTVDEILTYENLELKASAINIHGNDPGNFRQIMHVALGAGRTGVF